MDPIATKTRGARPEDDFGSTSSVTLYNLPLPGGTALVVTDADGRVVGRGRTVGTSAEVTPADLALGATAPPARSRFGLFRLPVAPGTSVVVTNPEGG
ncbi:MAG TPA: hypothetical protein VGW74_09370 [Propionibacteriaceae bacterium]|nr:hypothetical protein [Propionibacteriaceae bacterium]